MAMQKQNKTVTFDSKKKKIRSSKLKLKFVSLLTLLSAGYEAFVLLSLVRPVALRSVFKSNAQQKR